MIHQHTYQLQVQYILNYRKPINIIIIHYYYTCTVHVPPIYTIVEYFHHVRYLDVTIKAIKNNKLY